MRILFVVLSPISAELGAAQMAINLANALSAKGAEVVVWSPLPIPAEIHWSRRMAWIRQRIAEYVQQDGKFDFVDAPPIAVTQALSRQCSVIARNVQPEFLYFWTEFRHASRVRPSNFVAWAANAVYKIYYAILVLAGWFRAQHVFCLGRLDRDWMAKWFPWWRGKISVYLNAIGDDDRAALAEVRRNRRPTVSNETKFLWLGRWSAHKGPDLLLNFLKRRLAQYPNDRVTIAGCGPDVETLLPSELLRDERINLVPTYQRDELPKLLAEHDAGLFTSRVEGWGLTLQEMLESGMPVYATKAGAVIDLQPEFPSLIMNFPPESGEPTAPGIHVPLSQAYLARFSWSAIASGYLERIVERIESRPEDNVA